MSTLLYRIGKAAYRHPFKVLLAWLAILLILGGSLAVNTPQLNTEIRIDGTASQTVIDELTTALPEASGGQGTIVFRADDGVDLNSTDQSAALAAAAEQVYGVEEVVDPRTLMSANAHADAAERTDPAGSPKTAPTPTPADDQPTPLVVDGQPVPGMIISPDGSTALLQFQFTKQVFELSPDTIDTTLEAASEPAEAAGISVLPGSSMMEIPEVVGVGEIVGLGVAALVLIATLGSLVAAGLPLATAIVGVGVGISGAFAFSHLFELNSISVVLALMLGLAVGIDYSLFIVNRQRHLILDNGLSAHEAAGRAAGTAGSAVLFAGTTVIIALVALVVVGIKLLTVMALIAAATVAIAVIIALTLLPALLGLVGERIVPVKAREARSVRHQTTRHPVASAWSQFLVRHRILAAMAVIVIASVLAIPMTDMRLGLPSGEAYNSDSTQRQSYDAVTDAFGEGLNGPLMVVATSNDDTPIDPTEVATLAQDLSNLDGVASTTIAAANSDGTTSLLVVVPTTGPSDPATEDLVTSIRDRTGSYSDDLGIDVGVTGVTAMGIDVSEKMSEVLPIYLAVVLGLSLIVLMLVFRSVLVPIKATLGFLLSIVATFGVTTALFQWGWLNELFGLDTTGPVLALLPIIVTGVLYGLAMDYQVFLVSSMRESYVHGDRGSDAVVHGFNRSSRVVVAAAVIMVSVFAGFVFNGDPMVKQMGFALAVGILIDAFAVRITLVPAIMAMLGDRAWWLPRWLDRVLPDLDVEGGKLLQALQADESTTPMADS